MNPSTALARVLVDELVRGGVREAVLCPGSRNAPLSFALHDADRQGRLRLHVRIDERTAGFLALGLAKASGRPVPVVTTSGTAAVNLHPAVVEADYSRVPLVVLTADRPAELRGTGANQTIDQVNLYGGSVRCFAERLGRRRSRRWPTGAASSTSALGARRGAARCTSTWRSASRWSRTATSAGPSRWTAARVDRRAPRRAARRRLRRPRRRRPDRRRRRRPGACPDARGLAEAGGWPLLAEPSSGHRGRAERAGHLPAAARPPRRRHRAGRRRRPADAVPAGHPAAGPRPTSRCVRLRDDPRTPTVTGDQRPQPG